MFWLHNLSLPITYRVIYNLTVRFTLWFQPLLAHISYLRYGLQSYNGISVDQDQRSDHWIWCYRSMCDWELHYTQQRKGFLSTIAPLLSTFSLLRTLEWRHSQLQFSNGLQTWFLRPYFVEFSGFFCGQSDPHSLILIFMLFAWLRWPFLVTIFNRLVANFRSYKAKPLLKQTTENGDRGKRPWMNANDAQHANIIRKYRHF